MIVVVGVGNVSAMAVFDLNLKAVALVPRIVDCIKVVDAAVGDALSLTACCAHQEQQVEKQCEKQRLVAFGFVRDLHTWMGLGEKRNQEWVLEMSFIGKRRSIPDRKDLQMR